MTGSPAPPRARICSAQLDYSAFSGNHAAGRDNPRRAGKHPGHIASPGQNAYHDEAFPTSPGGPMKISSPRRPAASGTDQNDALPSLRNGVRDDVRELRLLFELSQLLDGAAHIGETLDGALCLMARHMAMMRGSISLVSPGDGSIHIESSYGLNAAEQARGHYAAGEGVTGTVIRTGRPMVISNVSDEPLFLNRTRSRNLRKDAVSFICVPIRADDQAIGALSVDRLFADTSTLEEDARLLTIIASMLARAARVRQSCLPERNVNRAARGHDRGRVSLRSPFFVGSCEAMQQVYARIDQVARSSATVLLRGESGTGKELTALAIHAASPRANRPFITLNCAALPETLVENELFGHERGAFTGAQGLYRGRFEQADGGTLFLDEVGDLPPLTQAKLLRVIQERSYERLGGAETRRADVRLITATNRPLEDMVHQGAFRGDLHYRLNVFPIELPPLRERSGDIALLAAHFMKKFAAAGGRTEMNLSLSAADMLQRYEWPGNIRELENIMERAVLLAGEEGVILPQHLPPELHSKGCPVSAPGVRRAQGHAVGPLQPRLDELEKGCILEALRRHEGNMGRAARELGLTDRIMALRMKKYGITYKEFRRKRTRPE